MLLFELCVDIGLMRLGYVEGYVLLVSFSVFKGDGFVCLSLLVNSSSISILSSSSGSSLRLLLVSWGCWDIVDRFCC